MRWLIGGFALLAAITVTILYFALVVASRADEEEHKYWEKRGDGY